MCRQEHFTNLKKKFIQEKTSFSSSQILKYEPTYNVWISTSNADEKPIWNNAKCVEMIGQGKLSFVLVYKF